MQTDKLQELLALPSSAISAVAAGARFYFNGGPCKEGHLDKRYAKSSECVTCRANRNRSKETIASQKAWIAANAESRNAKAKERYAKNRDYEVARTRAKYQNNPEKVKATNAAWVAKHPNVWSHYATKRRADLILRTPPWADLERVKQIYADRPDGYHIDHVIPLRGKWVSGLHVPENLQYLPAAKNNRKFNKYEVQ
jgi:hypothetical protein